MPFRGRTRLTKLLHSRLCPPGIPYYVTIRIGAVPLRLDLGEPLQTQVFYGFYEPYEVAFVRHTLRRGQVFVDAGANVGYYTAPAASLVGTEGEVHAFEPVPQLYHRLRQLAADAGEAGFRVYANDAALSDAEGEATLWVSDIGNIGWATIVPGAMPKEHVGETTEVRCIRLDEYFVTGGYRMPDMVKVDVELGELQLLEGMEGMFETGLRPILLCEVSAPTAGQVLAKLARLEYKPYYCTKGGQLKPITFPLPQTTLKLVFSV